MDPSSTNIKTNSTQMINHIIKSCQRVLATRANIPIIINST